MTQYEKMAATPVEKLIFTLSIPTILSMLISNIYNIAIALDPLLMFVFKLGVTGAGISTVFSQTVGWIIMISMFVRGKSELRLSVKKISLKPGLLGACRLSLRLHSRPDLYDSICHYSVYLCTFHHSTVALHNYRVCSSRLCNYIKQSL